MQHERDDSKKYEKQLRFHPLKAVRWSELLGRSADLVLTALLALFQTKENVNDSGQLL